MLQKILPGSGALCRRYGLFILCLVVLAVPGNYLSSRQTQAQTQHLWRKVSAGSASSERAGAPRAFHTWQLNRALLSESLRRAPLEFTTAARTAPQVLALPLPDGSLSRFSVVASPVMEPELAARHPEISTYAARGVDDPTAVARLSLTPKGLHAIILAEKGTFYIEPAEAENHLVYTHADLPADVSFACHNQAENVPHTPPDDQTSLPAPRQPVTGETLRIYRLAVATTGEYAQTYGGGTVAGALAAVTTTVNLLNAVYERDLAIRVVLVAGETSLIFTDPASDGYSSGNPNALINENQARLNSILGPGGYDVGHVLDGGTAASGFAFSGLASIGVACLNSNKGQGASLLYSVQPSNTIAYYVMAHEMGHQFGALHSFNGTTNGCASGRIASAAFEPGSGSTIMGYRYSCSTEDLFSSSTYFHIYSILQITSFVAGNGCPTLLATGNQAPFAEAGDNYTIPVNTPFSLTASGSDPNGDSLTYTWEQYDLGAPSPPGVDDGTRPLFRSLDPSANPTRPFPRLSSIVSGTLARGETWPATTRTMRYRVTVRDSRSGVSFDEMLLNTRAESGPFTVTQPANGVSWDGGLAQTVTWNVANTNAAPINTANVRLTLSTDGGQTFPYLLKDSTPNDGAETIIVPNLPTTTAHLRAEAVGNVFFNISAGFTIAPGAVVQLGAAGFAATEDSGSITVTVNRSGDTSRAVSVDYATADGSAQQLGDYTVTNGTLSFAAGETSKTVAVPLVNDAYPEGAETFTLTLSNFGGVSLNGPASAVLSISDDDASANVPNPLETAEFFVRQNYYDFLNRAPDAGGLAYWTGQITQCGADANCLRARRIGVSAAFFIELEFQDTGSFVYRFYKASYGTLPTYGQFTPDRARVIGGADLEASRQAFANQWVQRPEFLARYPASQSNAQFVDALLATVQTGSGVNLSGQRDALLATLNSGGTRAAVLRQVTDNAAFQQAEYNKAFVLMQYFGYLRRDPDTSGYDFWLTVIGGQQGNFRGMVCAFITSEEFQRRFGQQTPRTNTECVPGV